MQKRKGNSIEYLNLINSRGSGRIGAVIFQKNNIVRIDKRYMKKYLLKKLAKEKRNIEL